MEKYKHVRYICTECGHGFLVKYSWDEDWADYDIIDELDAACHKCGEIGVELSVVNGN